MYQTGLRRPAYHSQVHHVRGWAATRRTDIDDLALACGPDNRLAEKGWTTRTNARGDTEWIPRRTWTMDSREPMDFTTPKDSFAMATTNPFDVTRIFDAAVTRPLAAHSRAAAFSSSVSAGSMRSAMSSMSLATSGVVTKPKSR